MAEPHTKRWDTDQRGRGVGDARARLPAIQQLADLAGSPDWVTEDPEAHLLSKLRSRTEVTDLRITAVRVESDGTLDIEMHLVNKLTRRELRQVVWSILGGVAELSTHVRETQVGESVRFDVVTGIAPGDGRFATHGHTLRLNVQQAES
jgi:hypothetical protein